MIECTVGVHTGAVMDTGAEGGNVVFVKVRETYDLHTIQNKMTVIGIHTPKADIIKRNYPGLLLQCKAYRPVSCDVKIACASMQPLDPLGVGTGEGDVAPEDVFNPILYKAMSNFGMSQLEARINAMVVDQPATLEDVDGTSATVEVNGFTNITDEFPVYYGLLANTHDWKHASPQSGLSMLDLRPLVWEMVYNMGDNTTSGGVSTPGTASNGQAVTLSAQGFRGGSKPMPFINCTAYSKTADGGSAAAGFPYGDDSVANCSVDVPAFKVYVGAIIVPPSRLHQLYYRMVVEWTLEFSQIRSISEITDWAGLSRVGSYQHYQNYDYSSAKAAITGSDSTILDSDTCMVSANVDVNKVM